MLSILQSILNNILKILGLNSEIKDNSSIMIEKTNEVIYNTSKDVSGRRALNSVFGERIVAHEISSFNALFAYPSDPRKLKGTIVSTGTIATENYMLKIGTGTAADELTDNTGKTDKEVYNKIKNYIEKN